MDENRVYFVLKKQGQYLYKNVRKSLNLHPPFLGLKDNLRLGTYYKFWPFTYISDESECIKLQNIYG